MEDIRSYLELHSNKVSGLFPWELQEFVQWSNSTSYKGEIVISLENGDILFLTLMGDSIYYQMHWNGSLCRTKVIFNFDKPPYGAEVAAFFKESSYNAVSFFDELQKAVLALPFVDYVTNEEESTYVESVAKATEEFYKLTIGMKEGAEIDTTRSGLRSISKSIEDKIQGLTQTYGNITIMTEGNVYFNLNVCFEERTDSEENYNPTYEMSIEITYWVLPRNNC